MASSTSTCSVCGEGGITLSNSLMHSLACERRRREKKRKRSREEEEEPAAEKEEEMVVISWNTGGTDEPAPLARAEAIASILLQRKPHVVCLQEVTQESGPIFVRRLGGIGGYAVSPADVACRSSPFPDASYFTMTFSRKDVCTALVARRVPFPSSCMGRDVLVSGMRFAAKDVRVLNTHLESGAASSAVRCSQLSTFLDLLGGCSEEEGGEALLGIACGDLNVREAEVGNEKKVGQFQDAWEAVHGARDREHKYTWELGKNDNFAMKPGGTCISMRLDRAYVTGGQPCRFKLLGKERIQGGLANGRFPSDHWGIEFGLRTAVS